MFFIIIVIIILLSSLLLLPLPLSLLHRVLPYSVRPSIPGSPHSWKNALPQPGQPDGVHSTLMLLNFPNGEGPDKGIGKPSNEQGECG